MNKCKFGDNAVAGIESVRDSLQRVFMRSLWTTECYDKDGNLKWIEEDRPNVVTDEGINAMLDIMFHNATQKATWYVTIFDDNVTPLVSWTYDLFADSQANECEAYDELTRPEYVEAAASGKSITNSANKATFTMNDTKTIYGAALVSNSTKSNHAAGDWLFCVSTFASARAVVDDDVLKVTVTITGADT
jgi:hypothetical protein